MYICICTSTYIRRVVYPLNLFNDKFHRLSPRKAGLCQALWVSATISDDVRSLTHNFYRAQSNKPRELNPKP